MLVQRQTDCHRKRFAYIAHLNKRNKQEIDISQCFRFKVTCFLAPDWTTLSLFRLRSRDWWQFLKMYFRLLFFVEPDQLIYFGQSFCQNCITNATLNEKALCLLQVRPKNAANNKAAKKSILVKTN